MELGIGDFYAAKKHYMNSIVNFSDVNHRIRKEALCRLLGINKRIGFKHESPEKVLLSRYYITKKYVQIILDISSFPNSKTLK